LLFPHLCDVCTDEIAVVHCMPLCWPRGMSRVKRKVPSYMQAFMWDQSVQHQKCILVTEYLYWYSNNILWIFKERNISHVSLGKELAVPLTFWCTVFHNNSSLFGVFSHFSAEKWPQTHVMYTGELPLFISKLHYCSIKTCSSLLLLNWEHISVSYVLCCSYSLTLCTLVCEPARRLTL
jgi:hypothetical protein